MDRRLKLPITASIGLYLERFITSAITRIIRKNKSSSKVYSIYNIPYSSNSRDKYRQFDMHSPIKCKVLDNHKPCPVLFYIHGGSWSAGDKSYYSKLCKELVENLGIIVININYRLMPENKFETCITDVLKCIKLCLDNSNLFDIDTNKCFIAGDSAGAHLASLICALKTEKHLKLDCTFLGAVLLYGVYDLTKLGTLHFRTCKILAKGFKEAKGKNLAKFYYKMSPIYHITENFTPCFVTAGKTDKLCVETDRLITRLDELGIEYEQQIFPKNRLDARHAFINIELKARGEALTSIIKFIKSKI